MSISFPDAGEFRIRRSGEDWQAIKLAEKAGGWLTIQQVASFPQKVTIGEPTKGAHPMLSTWAFNGLPSGNGIARHNSTTTRRYRRGLVDARNPDFFASPVESVATTGAAAAFMPHNDLVVSGTKRLYGSFGTDIYLWDETPDTWTDTTYNLSAAAVNPGVAFAGTGTLRLFIPCGSTGYARLVSGSITNVAASGSQPAARDFVRLRSMLICLDVSGQLWWTVDGATWTPYGANGTLDLGITGRRLEVYKTGFGEPTVHIVTDSGLFVFDTLGPTIYPTELELPPHPYQGLSMERWRDQLFVSGGMGVYSWNGSTVNAMGLDRGHGFSNSTRGRIVDLCADLNSLWALVEGNATIDTLNEWTGEGWHTIWAGASSSLSKMVVSSAQGGYRLWWGYGNAAWTLPRPPDFANAEQQAEAVTGTFERDWNLVSGENDFEMAGFTKTAVAIAWNEFSQTDGPTTFYYRTDQSTTFAEIPGYVFPAGTGVSTTGAWSRKEYEFGYDATNARFYGEPFDWIEFLWDGGGSSSYTGPDIIKDMVFTFQKVPTGYRAWSLTLDLERCRELGQEDIADLIDALVLSSEYCDFQYQQDVYRVRFASWGGADETGQSNHGGVRNISIIEIPVTP